jgi:SAM-dependent methyltransferase
MNDPYKVISTRVRDQYEKYPYPDIDPENERPQVLVSSHLSLMCDVLWGGKKSPDNLRVLDAGCGTGSPLVAAALAYPNAEIVGIDFSESSLAKARQLAKRYNVKNVQFFHLPIERLPDLGMTFDFVISSGVLHHLPEPSVGLKAIADVLDPQGAVSVMLYGHYGRIGVYMLQEALQAAFDPDVPIEKRIPPTLQLARQLSSHHPMARRARGRELQEGKDAGIVDLLLHANDIPFDVPAVYKLCEDAGMKFHRWLFPLIYEPHNYLKDPLILETVEKFSTPERHRIAELIHGRNSKHSFFTVKPGFSQSDSNITKGNWRNLRAKLTPCLAWSRTLAVPGENGKYLIPPTVVQDSWGPMEISQWQLQFLSRINPEQTLGQTIQLPDIRKAIPFNSRAAVDNAVEKLLVKLLDNLAIVFIEKWTH